MTENIVDFIVNEQQFGIRAANIEEHRNDASMLINKMYSWRGYGNNHNIGIEPNKITLTATDIDNDIIGTVSLGIDSDIGLLADNIFEDIINPYRHVGKVCEITKLAVDISKSKSKEILASLFHVAFLYIRDIQQCSEIFIEVNPRHKRFYETMLGFQAQGDIRNNSRVNAPAVLLKINVYEGTQNIRELKDSKDRSLFSYFFSQDEEEGIINRLKNMEH